MPYSCACNTPLSNFEVQQNYKDVNDPAVVCRFPLLDAPAPRQAGLSSWQRHGWPPAAQRLPSCLRAAAYVP